MLSLKKISDDVHLVHNISGGKRKGEGEERKVGKDKPTPLVLTNKKKC